MPFVRIPKLKFYLSFLILVFFLGTERVCLAAQKPWQEHKTMHYIIFFQDAPEAFIESLGVEAENLFGTMADNMGFDSYPAWRQDERIKIYVYNGQEDYEADGQGNRRERTRGMAHIKQRAISTFVQGRDSFLTVTLPHELGHLFFWEYVGLKADVPGWFSEGIAMMQEKRDQANREDLVKQLVRAKGDFSLNKIPKGKNTDQDYFYPVAYSATKYLLSRVKGNKVNRLYDLLRDGSSFEAALVEVSNGNIQSLERFNQDWLEAVKENNP